MDRRGHCRSPNIIMYGITGFPSFFWNRAQICGSVLAFCFCTYAKRKGVHDAWVLFSSCMDWLDGLQVVLSHAQTKGLSSPPVFARMQWPKRLSTYGQTWSVLLHYHFMREKTQNSQQVVWSHAQSDWPGLGNLISSCDLFIPHPNELDDQQMMRS